MANDLAPLVNTIIINIPNISHQLIWSHLYSLLSHWNYTPYTIWTYHLWSQRWWGPYWKLECAIRKSSFSVRCLYLFRTRWHTSIFCSFQLVMYLVSLTFIASHRWKLDILQILALWHQLHFSQTKFAAWWKLNAIFKKCINILFYLAPKALWDMLSQEGWAGIHLSEPSQWDTANNWGKVIRGLSSCCQWMPSSTLSLPLSVLSLSQTFTQRKKKKCPHCQNPGSSCEHRRHRARHVPDVQMEQTERDHLFQQGQ